MSDRLRGLVVPALTPFKSDLSPDAGAYVVAVYHDENANADFDRDLFDIPSEGYGFSNNPGFRFGLPEMEEIRFTVEDEPTRLSIRLTYL